MGRVSEHLFSKAKTHLLPTVCETFNAKSFQQVLVGIVKAGNNFQSSFLYTLYLFGLDCREARVKDWRAILQKRSDVGCIDLQELLMWWVKSSHDVKHI